MFIRFALCAIASLGVLSAAPPQRYDKVTSETVAFAPGGTIHIEGSTGDLNIEGWDQPSVEVTATRVLWSKNSDHAKRLLEALDIEKPTVSGSELVLKTLHKRRRGVAVSYRIRVPRASRLVVDHGIGTVFVYDLAGDVTARAKAGDILLQVPDATPPHQFNLRVRFGGITTQTMPVTGD